MKRMAVFTEGRSELIFLRHLLLLLFDPSQLSFQCLYLQADSTRSVPFEYASSNPTIHFLLIDVGGDGTVITAIKERARSLIGAGYDAVIGLRDMYSDGYCKLSSEIDDDIIQKFVDGHNKIIQGLPSAQKITLCWAIMEFESWLLGMYNLFIKINPKLTPSLIRERLGISLKEIDPQIMFFHPAVDFGSVLSLVNINYKKTESQLESITSKIDHQDVADAHENGRCSAFKEFLAQITA